jgi:hypothetical protein
LKEIQMFWVVLFQNLNEIIFFICIFLWFLFSNQKQSLNREILVTEINYLCISSMIWFKLKV